MVVRSVEAQLGRRFIQRIGCIVGRRGHVVVIPHQELVNGRVKEKAYFYDSTKGDSGGGGSFDFLVDEALERAKRFAFVNNIAKVVVRAKQP